MLSGVPQSSVLGPLLYLFFVNDLSDWIKNSMRMFADDVKIGMLSEQMQVMTAYKKI